MKLKQTIHVHVTGRDLQSYDPYAQGLRGGLPASVVRTAEEIQASGDHELLNWIIALGIIGDTPAEIVDVREAHTQLAFRVAAIWE
jgi:hypothetical protein